MRILLVNHYAGHPQLGMEYRPYYMAREWQKQGHEVEIVACSESHVRQKTLHINGWKTHETIDGIRYTWLKGPSYSGNGFWRLLNMLSFVMRLWIYGRYFVKTPTDVVIASSTYPLDVYPCHALAKRWNARFIFEVHDLWPLSPIELGGISPRHPLMQFFQHAEEYGYRHCDALVSMLPCTLQHMQSHGLDPRKFYHIPNGVLVDDWPLENPVPDLHQSRIVELKKQGKFLLAYTGAHGAANDLLSLIEAARHLDTSVHLLLVGQGPEKRSLMDQAQKWNLKNVDFLPAINKDQIPALLDQMDALYIGLAPQPLFRFGVSPNKLMDYMMAGKPIIYAIESGNHPVADFKCGIETPPGNPERLAKSIISLKNTDRTQQKAMGLNGKEAVKKNFDYSYLAQQFLQTIKNGGVQRLP